MVEPTTPPDHLADLPEETRKFLSQLREEDLDTLKEGLRLVIAVRTVGKFSKWLIVTVVGAFIGLVMVWESILKFLKFIGPATK